jgi:hypothetical protein
VASLVMALAPIVVAFAFFVERAGLTDLRTNTMIQGRQSNSLTRNRYMP